MSNFAQELKLYDENDANPFSIQHATTGTTMNAKSLAVDLDPGEEFIVNSGGVDHKVIPNGTCTHEYLHWDHANATWKGGGSTFIRLGCDAGVGSASSTTMCPTTRSTRAPCPTSSRRFSWAVLRPVTM